MYRVALLVQARPFTPPTPSHRRRCRVDEYAVPMTKILYDINLIGVYYRSVIH
jgi:hypothetical protein